MERQDFLNELDRFIEYFDSIPDEFRGHIVALCIGSGSMFNPSLQVSAETVSDVFAKFSARFCAGGIEVSAPYKGHKVYGLYSIKEFIAKFGADMLPE